jgi:hypothetical protein
MNNDFPRMIYKAGGAEEIHGGKFDHADRAGRRRARRGAGRRLELTTDEARTRRREAGGCSTTPTTAPRRPAPNWKPRRPSWASSSRRASATPSWPSASKPRCCQGLIMAWTKQQIIEQAFDELALAGYVYDLARSSWKARCAAWTR